MVTPVGWLVGVWVGLEESDDPAYDTALYVAGYIIPAEAEAAVTRLRSKKGGEQIEVPEGPIVSGIGPQPKPGEVQRLRGAV